MMQITVTMTGKKLPFIFRPKVGVQEDFENTFLLINTSSLSKFFSSVVIIINNDNDDGNDDEPDYSNNNDQVDNDNIELKEQYYNFYSNGKSKVFPIQREA